MKILPNSGRVGHSEGLTPALVVDVAPDQAVPEPPVTEPVQAGLDVVRELPQHGDLTLSQDHICSLPH